MTLPDSIDENPLALPLYADESVSDLNRGGFRLIQPTGGFRFGEDTVLLADFASRLFAGQPGRRLRIADLGAGCGASSILLAARLPAASILAVELDKHSLSALNRNVRLNGLTDRLTIFNSDYSQWPAGMPCAPDGSSLAGSFDLVIANPPYGLSQQVNGIDARLKMAREEHAMTLDSLLEAARLLLRPHGRLALIHRSVRLTDILLKMRQHQIEPKDLRLVSSIENRAPARVLLSGVHQARPGSLNVQAQLVIRDAQHRLTTETVKIYSNDPPLTEGALFTGLARVGRDWNSSTDADAQYRSDEKAATDGGMT